MRVYISTLCAIILFSACTKKEDHTHEVQRTERTPQLGTAAVNYTAGIKWDIPEDWRVEAERPMRVATYSTDPVDDDRDRGEVAVFYFGPGEGGSVDANVQRWFGQFDQPDGRPTREVAETSSITINGIRVTLVSTTGTYNAAAGPMAPRQDIRPGYKLLGAIAEGPQGAVFFKFTGPEKTVRHTETDFMNLVRSIKKE